MKTRAAGDPSRLTPESRDLLANPATELLFSTASIWEVVIKNALGRRDFRVEPRQLRDGLTQNGYGELAIRSEHALDKFLPPEYSEVVYTKNNNDSTLLKEFHLDSKQER